MHTLNESKENFTDIHLTKIFLRVLIEWNSATKLANISITLDTPGQAFAAKEEGRDLNSTAFAEIDCQLENHKATLRGEHF
jgi:hypothetical protein